jgi:hypothetical protein
MGADNRTVDRPQGVVEAIISTESFPQKRKHSLQNSFRRPTVEMGIHGFPGTEFHRQISPRRTASQNPTDAVECLSRWHWRAPRRLRTGKAFFDDRPFFV